MSERRGKILSYNAVNRLGEIQPEGTTLRCRFYLPVVANPEPTPKTGDVVTFEAPEPRKNKQGKAVQGDATSVTVVEYAPAPPPRPQQAPRHARDLRGKGRSGQRGARRERPDDKNRPQWQMRDRAPKERERAPRARPERAPRRAPSEGPRDRKPRTAFSQARFELPQGVGLQSLDNRACHPGLLLDRLIPWPRQGWQLSEDNRGYFLERSVIFTQHGVAERVLPFFALRKRQEDLLSLLSESGESVQSATLRLGSRLVLATRERAILNGVGGSWRWTEAVPKVPGSLIKGHLKAFIQSGRSPASEAIGSAVSRLKAALEPGSGFSVTFFDAIAVSKAALLQLDGTLCTQPAWIAHGHAPSPSARSRSSHFLAIKPGADFFFSLAVAGESEKARGVADDALAIIQYLAGTFGFGALTEAGYGRFYSPPLREPTQSDLPEGESAPASETSVPATSLES